MNQKKMPSLGGESTDRIELANSIAPVLNRVRRDVSAIKLPDGSRWTSEPLTDERVHAHLNGGTPRGACPIHEGQSTTRLALFDLDSHAGELDWPAMAKTARDIAEVAALLFDLHATAFRSSGGRGIHLFFIWNEPQDAHSVRRTLAEVLAACGLRDGARGVAAGEVEVFPKQDEVPVGGHGNQFILPLAGKSVPLDADMRECSAPTWAESSPVHVVERPARVASETAGVEPLARVEAALFAIPNEHDYEDWLRLLFSVREATGGSDAGLELFERWSAQCDRHDEAFLRREWGRRDRGGVTRATLFAEALRHGWQAGTAPSAEGFEDVPAIASANDERPVLTPPDCREDHTDAGNANILRTSSAGGMRFVVETERWLHWTGARWIVDESGAATLTQAKQVAEHWRSEAEALRSEAASNPERDIELLELAEICDAWARKCRSRSTLDAMLSLAQRDAHMVISLSELDQHRHLLGVANGVVDLRTGELLPNARGMLVTKHSPYEFVPGALAPRWCRFIAEITGQAREGATGDYKVRQHLADYLHALLGYALTGEVREHKMSVWEGAGSNGKDVALGAVGRVMGPYACVIPPEALMTTRRDADANAPSPIVAGLVGVRLAVSSESREGQRLDVALIKRHTGGGRLKGRMLHSNPVEFEATHKLILMTNAAPGLDHLDEAIRGRVHRLKFERRWNRPGHPDPDPQLPQGDKGLPDTLGAESVGILAWLVAGAVRYYRDGLEPPPEVIGATVEFFDAADALGQWLTTWERCPASEGTGAGDLFVDYGLWCRVHAMRQQQATPTAFGLALQRRAVERGRSKVGTVYGLRRPGF